MGGVNYRTKKMDQKSHNFLKVPVMSNEIIDALQSQEWILNF